jgi:NAD(P)-dependent dehydrogenase (short-subunit alcohol dehydrogenase family)
MPTGGTRSRRFWQNLERLKAAGFAEKFSVALYVGDVSRATDCVEAVELATKRFGKLDAVMRWPAMLSTTDWSELDVEEFSRVNAVNVTGSFLIAQVAARHMVERKAGSIVLCMSGAVLFGGVGGPSGAGGPRVCLLQSGNHWLGSFFVTFVGAKGHPC